ncbi:hypothetical protein ACLOJK_038585 [Asimina triloba]
MAEKWGLDLSSGRLFTDFEDDPDAENEREGGWGSGAGNEKGGGAAVPETKGTRGAAVPKMKGKWGGGGSGAGNEREGGRAAVPETKWGPWEQRHWARATEDEGQRGYWSV